VYRLVRGAFYAPPKIKSTVFCATLFKWSRQDHYKLNL
jgi:hypothetical protein